MPHERRYSMTLRKRKGKDSSARTDSDESPLPEEVAALLELSSRPLSSPGRRPSFPCSICNKRFSTKKMMMIHKSVHFREVPFACLDCFKTFHEFGLLQKHKESHRRYRCAICKSAFQCYSSFRMHLLVHPVESIESGGK